MSNVAHCSAKFKIKGAPSQNGIELHQYFLKAETLALFQIFGNRFVWVLCKFTVSMPWHQSLVGLDVLMSCKQYDLSDSCDHWYGADSWCKSSWPLPHSIVWKWAVSDEKRWIVWTMRRDFYAVPWRWTTFGRGVLAMKISCPVGALVLFAWLQNFCFWDCDLSQGHLVSLAVA